MNKWTGTPDITHAWCAHALWPYITPVGLPTTTVCTQNLALKELWMQLTGIIRWPRQLDVQAWSSMSGWPWRVKKRGKRKIPGEAAEVLEEAFVIRTFWNGVDVFESRWIYPLLLFCCPFFWFDWIRLGIERLAMFKKDMQFDVDNYTISVGETTIGVFDKMTVCVEVKKDKNTQQGQVKMHMTLVPL